MAVDSDIKRISANNQLTGQYITFPDGTIDQPDRQATARSYAGIMAWLGPPDIVIGDLSVTPAISGDFNLQPAVIGTTSTYT